VRPCRLLVRYSVGSVLLLISLAGTFASTSLAYLATEAWNSQRVTLTNAQGFCPGGVYGASLPMDRPRDIHTWGSFCGEGDRTTGVAITSAFVVPTDLVLYLAGYPSDPSISVQVEKIEDGSRFVLKPKKNPAENWVKCDFPLPYSWRSKSIRLIVQDNATGHAGWVGFSEPLSLGATINFHDSVVLVLKTSSHLILIMVPVLRAARLQCGNASQVANRSSSSD
jgi:hypothetical protein